MADAAPTAPRDRPRRGGSLVVALACLALLAVPILGIVLLPAPKARVAARPSPSVVSSAPAAPLASSPPRPRPPMHAPLANPIEPPPSGPGIIEGTVLDPDGVPSADAIVVCEGGGADGKGRFDVRTDPNGRYVLPAEANGCRAVAHHPSLEASEVVAVRPGAPNELRLARAGAIAGVVVDEGGQPVTSFWIGVESFTPRDGDGEISAGGRTRQFGHADGSFTMEGLYAGRYVLSAGAEGFVEGRSAGVDVERGRASSGVRIVLARGGVLTGTVVDASTRKPVAGARLAFDGASSVSFAVGRGRAPNATDASGRYRLEGVPQGPFSVRVDADGYRQKIVTGLDARGRKELSEDVAITPLGDGGAGSEFGGVGATLAPSPKGVLIAGVMPNSPAERAGLQRGDRIVRIEGASAFDLTVADAVQRLRGPEGTRVAVSVARDGDGTIDVVLTRETIVR